MTIEQRLTTSSANDSEEKFGFILMLDALGVSSFNHLEQRQWLENRDLMLRHLAQQQAWHLNNLKNDYETACAQIKLLGLPLDSLTTLNEMIALYQEIQMHSDFASFGDTIVFHSWCSDRYDSYEYSIALIAAIGLSLHEVMKANIKFGLKLRGALSFGRYFKSSDGNTILGSALIEAYKFYEVADWIGIVIAPGLAERHMDEAENVVNQAIKREGLANIEQFITNGNLSYQERLAITSCAIFQRYEVPLSKGGKQSFWVPSWPISLFLDKITGNAFNALRLEQYDDALQSIQGLIQERDSAIAKFRPKYANTIMFFNDIWDRVKTISQAIPPRAEI